MKYFTKILFFETVKSKVIISLFETVRLSVSISLRNLYNSLKSIKEITMFRNAVPYFFGYKMDYSPSKTILKDGSRSLGLFREGKIGILPKFPRTDLAILEGQKPRLITG